MARILVYTHPMQVIVQQGDTVGLLCERHGISREQFFEHNPDKIQESFFTSDLVRTSYLYEGEKIEIGNVHLERLGDHQFSDGKNEYDVMYADSASSSIGFAVGAYLVLGMAFTVGVYYLLWRGVKAVAKES